MKSLLKAFRAAKRVQNYFYRLRICPFEDLQSSATKCTFCAILMGPLYEYKSRWPELIEEYTVDIYPRDGRPLRLIVNRKPVQIGTTVLVLEYLTMPAEGGGENVWTDYFGVGTFPQTGYTSEECIAMVKKWLATCLNKHPYCRQSGFRPKSAPRRLLRLDKTEAGFVVKLIETAGKAASYVALSHCWGNLQFIRTTCETYSDRDASGQVMSAGNLQGR